MTNYTTSEYKNSKIAQKTTSGSVVMCVLVIAVFTAMFVQFAKVI